jgi:site-specific DNA recombinase
MANRTRTASLYVRLSREAGDTNLSLAGMMADLRQLAESMGYTVVGQHTDNGKSGAIRDRPELIAWLSDALTGRTDTLFASHTDRITREGVNAAAAVLDVVEGKDPATGRVVRAPVRLVTADGLDSERDAEAFRWRFVIAAEVARAERERIKARNARTQARLAAAGRWDGSPIPWGWRVVPAEGGGKALAPEPAEARFINERLAPRFAAGDSMRALTRWMNTTGLRTRRGGEWTTTSVRKVLHTAATKDLITDRALCRAVLARMDRAPDAPSLPGGRPTKYLASGGGAYCDGCRTPMTTSAGRYVCNSERTGKACPAPATVTASMLDPWITEEWLEALGDSERTVTVPASDEVDHELDEVAAEIAAVAAQFASAAPGEIADLAARLTALRAREAELEDRPRHPDADLFVIAGTGETWGQAWESAGDAENRRALLRETGFRVYVGKARTRGDRDVAGRCRVVWL